MTAILKTPELRAHLAAVSDEDFEKFVNGYAIGFTIELLTRHLSPQARWELFSSLTERAAAELGSSE
jgi:hypothetical protein